MKFISLKCTVTGVHIFVRFLLFFFFFFFLLFFIYFINGRLWWIPTRVCSTWCAYIPLVNKVLRIWYHAKRYQLIAICRRVFGGLVDLLNHPVIHESLLFIHEIGCILGSVDVLFLLLNMQIYYYVLYELGVVGFS